MKYLKKLTLLIFSIISIFIFTSFKNTNSKTSGLNAYLYTMTKITLLYDKTCEFDDTGKYNNDAYYNNGYIEGEKRSVPLFDFWFIDKASTNKKIPSFIMVGDRIKFKEKKEVLAQVDDAGNEHPIFDFPEFKSIIINEDFEIEYIRAEVSKIEESSINRDGNGYVLSISNYASQKNITIDKEYHYISLNEYNGENIYVSSGNGIRLYSFNPLEE